MLASWKESYDKPGQRIKKQRHHFVDKGLYSQCYGFSSSHVWMWDLDYKEGRCFQIVVSEKTLKNLLDSKAIQLVNPKGNHSWIFIGRTDAEAEAPVLWPPDVKNWLIGKDPDAGKDWRQEEKGMTEDEMVEWHHWLDRHEFEQAPGVANRQGSLVCCSPWGHEESDTTEQLNWTESNNWHRSKQISQWNRTGNAKLDSNIYRHLTYEKGVTEEQFSINMLEIIDIHMEKH